MDIKSVIAQLVERVSLSTDESRALFEYIMTGEATPAQIAAVLTALRMKGESTDEITGAASAMRALSQKVEVSSEYLVDTCGTGGDGASTFNISTAVAFVAAAAGAKVAKHGNRSVSSSSGSADLLEAAGVNINLTPELVGRSIESLGVGFLFAPLHHSAMKHAIGPRRELGMRTIFNLLGPLTNPAGAPNQLLGVFSPDWVEPLATVLQALGSRHVMVVSAEEGLDEITVAGPTRVAELKGGSIECYTITPEQFGMERADLSALAVNDAQESLAMVRSVLSNTPGPALDIVVLNAGAAIYVSGIADSYEAGIEMARDAIGSGLAKAKLHDLMSFSASFS